MKKTITQLIERVLGQQLSPTAALDLPNHGLDSLAIVQLTLDLEKRFSIELMTDSFKVDHFKSVDSVKKLIEFKQALHETP